jgi:hypothetical protein
MEKKISLLTLLILLLLSSNVHLRADKITYYFTGVTDSLFSTHSNWNTQRDGTGDTPPTNTLIHQNKTATFVVQPSIRDTVVSTTYQSYYSSVIIEEGANLKFTGNGTAAVIYQTDTTTVTIQKGASLIGNNVTLTLYPSKLIFTIAGKMEIGYIKANNKTNTRTVDVQKDAEVILKNTSYGFLNDSIHLINNGTIKSAGGSNSVISIAGQGTLSVAGSLTVSYPAASTFLQSGGGTVIYDNGSGALVSSYNHLEIKNVNTDKSFTGESAIHGNFTIADNTGQVTLANNITVAGNLTIADTKAVTTGVLSVAGDVAVSNLAEGSVLNVTLNGTAQNIKGVFNNLEVAAGTTATLTGDLTAENLVLVGTLLNPDGYTLTVTNQTGIEAYKLQLQIAVGEANSYTESVYTVESWATLSGAVSAAQTLLADENATTIQLEEAKTVISAAIAALVTNLSVLQSAVSAAKTNYANPTVYTAATYEALQTAITAAEAFLEGKTAITPADVSTYKDGIDAAIAALVREIYTFYLLGGSATTPANWNTQKDGSGVAAVDFTGGNTYIATAGVAVSGLPTFSDSHVIFEATETPATDRLNPVLNGSNLTVQSGRTIVNLNTSSAAFTGTGGKITVEEGGSIGNSRFNNPFNLEINGELELRAWTDYGQNPVNRIENLTGTGTLTAKNVFTISDAASSTFLQAGGGTLVYHLTDSLQPSYNHLTVKEVNAAGTFSREVESAFPTVPVHGNLLLDNNSKRVTFSNPLDVKGNFTVDYDREDEAVVQATLSVAGNVSLSGLEDSDNALHVTLTGTTAQNLSGAGFTSLTVPDTVAATLTGNLRIEEALALNGILDRNGKTIQFGERTGAGVLTDGLVAAALQDSIDEARAAYPDGSLYTDESWAVLQTALANGETLLSGTTPAEADSLEAAIAAIAAAIDGLQTVYSVVAAALQDSIAAARADYPDGSPYTAESWEALQDAIDAGEALLAGTTATVTELEAAIAAIAAAIDGLQTVHSVLAAALQDSIAAARAAYPDGSPYTAESWAALQAALDAGEALLASTTATVADLEAAIAAIAAAIDGLTEKQSGLRDVTADDWKIAAGNSSLVITGNVEVKIFSLVGRQLHSGWVKGEKAIPLPAGVYIVSANGRTVKVLVK